MMAVLKVKFDEEQMGELVARVIEHFAIDNGNITEIVRCKDCKWKKAVVERGVGSSVEGILCGVVESLMCPDDFCSYGERRDEE